MKTETEIITSIAASLIERAVIPVKSVMIMMKGGIFVEELTYIIRTQLQNIFNLQKQELLWKSKESL